MKIEDISTEIFVNMGSPDSTSIPAIAFFLRSKIGTINTLLYENYSIDPLTYEIINDDGTEITSEAVAVMQKMYEIYDIDVQIRSQMNALAINSIIEFREADGSSFKRSDRNSISKNYASMKKDELGVLKDMVTAYRLKKAIPLEIVGTDVDNLVFGDYTTYGRIGNSR